MKWRWAAAAIALVILVLGGRALSHVVVSLMVRVAALGALAPVAFIVVYAAGEIVFVPGSLVTMAAGALFGVIRGAAFAFIGATLGAVAAFLVARHLLRGVVTRRGASSNRLRTLDAAIAKDGLKVVLLVRLTPLIPFNALNYALGVTQVRLRDYVLGSVGMIPGTLLYASYGKLIGDAARIAAGETPKHGVAFYGLLVVGLAATIALTIVLSRLARKALTASPELESVCPK